MQPRVADALSFSRLLLFVPWIISINEGNLWALPIMSVIVASDVLDGMVARRLALASQRGAIIDVVCDIVVIVTAFITLGFRNWLYIVLLVLTIVALLSWVVYTRIAGEMAYTRLGKYNGGVCYLAFMVVSARPWLEVIHLDILVVLEECIIYLVALFLGAAALENYVKSFALHAHRRGRL